MKFTFSPEELEELKARGIDPNSFMMGLSTQLLLQSINKAPKNTKNRGCPAKIDRNMAITMAHNLYSQARGLGKNQADLKVADIFGFTNPESVQKIRNGRIKNKTTTKLIPAEECEQFIIDGVNGSPSVGMILEPGALKFEVEKNEISIDGYGWLWIEGEKKAEYKRWKEKVHINQGGEN